MPLLRFVQVSDIHFRDFNDDPHDTDSFTRKALIQDVVATLRGEKVNALIVSGDVAYSGKPEEYTVAKKWLMALAQQIKLSANEVWLVPGNHDFDRSTLTDSKVLRSAHSDIRGAKPGVVDREISEYLRDKISAQVLLNPFTNYNDFAFDFSSTTTPEQLYWTTEIQFDDKYLCKLHGLNSAVLAAYDEDDEGDIIIGLRQCQFADGQDTDEIGEIHVAICHHPVGWWKKHSDIDAHVSHARVVLSGHTHNNFYTKVDDTVHCSCNAVQPDRREDKWQPGYNIVTLELRYSTAGTELEVRVVPRAWNKAHARYDSFVVEEGKTEFVRKVSLKPLSKASAQCAPLSGDMVVADVASATLSVAGGEGMQQEPASIAALPADKRELIMSKFIPLAFDMRLRLLADLGLFVPEDEKLNAIDRMQSAILRGNERDGLQSLAAAIEKLK